MKKILLTIMAIATLFACKSDDEINQNNPNYPNAFVQLSLNLNLPEYNNLRFPGGSFITTTQGTKGVVVYNVNNDLYTAFELTDPNHPPSTCSRMTLNGIITSCSCGDGNTYDVVTGSHQTDENLFPMTQYRIVKNGNTLRITN
ncbi:hypothetical protein ULMS_01110 [Patiriisocius marinistellae]|uniref:Nitrite reductase/ring-hydroxylating ferredoxin subunit n=1 Tax=Patiriisocius marinistellae TaxID=2494560 RepID=A0A5J4FT27_9FLAO|nr:hypothetical protein [Patiriisocius marinistellae]GEQ84603.1 hypothetical protein ULMS_01110 [Patiriisocius marinistellae]